MCDESSTVIIGEARLGIGRWSISLGAPAARYLVSTLNFLIRPKLTEAEAMEVVRQAAIARGWQLEGSEDVWRHMHLYGGVAVLAGTDVTYEWTVNGRSGELLELKRVDETHEGDLRPSSTS